MILPDFNPRHDDPATFGPYAASVTPELESDFDSHELDPLGWPNFPDERIFDA